MANVETQLSARNAIWYSRGDGYYYRKKELRVRTLKLKCINIKNEWNCKAIASVAINNGQIVGPIRLGYNWQHTHPPDDLRGREEDLRRVLLITSEGATTKLKRVYDEETKNFPSAIVARRQYPSVNSGMRKRKKKHTPVVPDNLPNLYFSLMANKPDLLTTYDNEPFVVFYNEENLMFVSPGTAPLLHNELILFCMDGTFKCTPKKPKVQQFYVLGGMIGKTFIAIAYILMEKKTEAAYQWMFQKLLEYHPGWAPQHFLTDFETGILAAVSQRFPLARHQGCWFHFSQAIEKKAKKIGLTRLVRDVGGAKDVVKRLMALALLPPNQIQIGFNTIVAAKEHHEVLAVRNSNELTELLNYVQHYWINQIGSERVSASNSQNRTNNSQEAFNKHILLHTEGPHPDCFAFIAALKMTEHQMTSKYIAQMQGIRTNYPLARKWILHHRRIENACMLLDIGAYTIEDFLATVSHSRNFNLLGLDEAMQEVAALAGVQLPQDGQGPGPLIEEEEEEEEEEDVDDPEEIQFLPAL